MKKPTNHHPVESNVNVLPSNSKFFYRKIRIFQNLRVIIITINKNKQAQNLVNVKSGPLFWSLTKYKMHSCSLDLSSLEEKREIKR